jgi:hypothetical protein
VEGIEGGGELRKLVLLDKGLGRIVPNESDDLLLKYLVSKRGFCLKPEIGTELFLTERFKWNVYTTGNNLNKTHSKNYNPLGHFYLPFFTNNLSNAFTSSVPEINNFNNVLRDRGETIQRDVWLYKYSNLSRLALKSGTALTNTKKLLGTGLYSYGLNQENLWAQNELTNFQNWNSLSNTLYGSNTKTLSEKFFLTNKGWGASLHHNKKLTQFHETSYL